MRTKESILKEIFDNDPLGILDDKKMTIKQAEDILENAKVAILRLVLLGADYEIWQNAKISYKTLKQINKELKLIG